MNPEDWRKVKDLFDTALKLAPDERERFLDKTCAEDNVLRREVENLLASFKDDSFMEQPAAEKFASLIVKGNNLENGRTIAHYEIVRQIGAGGMGEVYLAKDKKLDRKVAVKFLNEKFSRHESNLNRFIKEAKAASALNHPNILVVHEIGESEDAHYIVSEFVEGKTLREIFKESPLELSEVLDFSIQIANALTAAHTAHIVHRDIKPENIIVRPDGFVKILDFGLAKLIEQKVVGFEDETVRQNETAKGIILGTISYMSPEQAKGERVDARTDIFSLGVVIYEMMAGRTPFAGDSMSETFANLINSEPQPLSRFAESVPDELQRIVAKTLRKNKDERYQTMTGLLADLKSLQKRLNFEAELEHSSSPNKQAENKTQIFKAEVPEKTPKLAPNNLTENLSPIVGREKEIVEIGNLLKRGDVRLITMTGIGGTGKTRLAQAAAQSLLTDFKDGVFFIELASVTNPELVASAIAQPLGVKESGGKPILEILKDYLRDKQTLIVVDNFEQVIAAAPNIAELIHAADKLKILITSRVLLHLRAEREFVVPPLALPSEDLFDDYLRAGDSDLLADLQKYEAVELFVARARNARANFALSEDNARSVAEICARLDGLPLAIELAAARVKIISPQMILAKLENRLQLLTGGAKDLPARQQTICGAVAWSYDLLTEDEKRLFRRLAVFAGGFTFEAAEAVGSRRLAEGSQEQFIDESVKKNSLPSNNELLPTANRLLPTVLDGITSLVDKSLLVSKEQSSGEMRFRMLETVREYALESLEKNNETEAMRRSHAAYFLALGEEAGLHLQTAQAGEWLNRLEDEHDNLRDALQWLFENEAEMAARLAAAIRIYLINHSHLTEGREWLETALEQGDKLPAAVRFKLLNGLGYLAAIQGDYETARKFFEEDLAEGRTAGDKRRIAESLRGLGIVTCTQGDYTAARKFYEEGLAIHRELNDKLGIAASLNGLGGLALDVGDTATARPLFEESLTNFRLVGNESGICYSLLNLAGVAYINGNYEAAREYYGDVLIIAQNLGYKDRIFVCLDGFAALAAERENWKMSIQLAGAAEKLRETIGYEAATQHRDFCLKYLGKVRAALSEADFAKLYKQGRKLKLEEAVALCLEENKTAKIQTLKTNPSENEIGEYSVNQKVSENSYSPDSENAAEILQATAGDGNKQTAEALSNFSQRIKRHKPAMFALLTALIIASAGIVYVWYNFMKYFPMNFQAQKSTRLTAVGKAATAAISPDGKYVVYVLEDGGQQSIWLRHIASESTVQLLPPDKNVFSSLQFSPDNNHVYYNSKNSLYQIPVLGGTPGKVLDDIYGGLTFSPDAKQIAFRRFRRIQGATRQENLIIIADADGTNQRELISREDIFDSKIAWSPDGKIIACVRLNREKYFNKEILAVQVADGTVTLIPSPFLFNIIGQVTWMPDGKSLLIVAADMDGDAGLTQIQQVQYPGGETRTITKDLSNYTNVSLTADGNSLVSVKLEKTAHLWMMPADDSNRLRQITFGSNKYDGILGICWLPDGKIVYDSLPDRKDEVWVVGADGNNSRQLTTNAGSPAVSPDGRYLVYQNTIKEKLGLWRMEISDGSKKQLTQKADLLPNFSPDGKWIIYQGFTDQNPPASLYKVSIDGGDPVQLTKNIIPFSPTVSPDGKQIAFSFGRMEEGKYRQRIALIPFSGGEITKMFDANLQAFDYGKQNLQWTPDGRAISYITLDNGVSNIWQQAIDGSAPVQVTNFTTDRIFNFAFSPDGSQLTLSRGTFNSDVVLIENLK
ncbi:MAG: protein kinase domain-containing protein [Pyrinomonadaceae bacterium]